ncbi:VOC family protein [Actinomadura terrae]|uniref:VOC family protein n=1 Tax=Actinomadura terrae TaxID=604353 RepID=UPI001FA745DF|nr:VOC family protein [Actinomadura terrae]
MTQMKFELVPVPVADVDRAKAFYTDKLGFAVDVDVEPGSGPRIVQLTPPGSACSILLSRGLPGIAEMTPGSLRSLHLVVADARATRAELAAKGVDVGEVDEHEGAMLFVPFADPDGNTWVLQEMPWRSADFTP